jgi:N-methylhydantoinase B
VTAASNGSCSGIGFFGRRPDKSTWIYIETIGGGSGARYNKDGLDGVHVHMTNTSNLPIEALESEYPLTVLRYELVDGSGGAGAHRGGMGLRRVYRAQESQVLFAGGSRRRSQPWGLRGGLPGASGVCTWYEGAGPATKQPGATNPGDVIEVVTPGAGGYGPPLERDRAKVREDLQDGCISLAQAREVYGYVDRKP